MRGSPMWPPVFIDPKEISDSENDVQVAEIKGKKKHEIRKSVLSHDGGLLIG